MLIFLPLGVADLEALRRTGLTDRAAHATTPALFAALGYEPSMSEDAEFAALTYASIAALTAHPRRLVVVAEVPERAVSAADDAEGFGLVRVASVAWSQATSLFAGDAADAAAESAAAAAARNRSLAEAWEEPAVEALVAETDLCWYGPDEADVLAAALA